MLVWTDLETTGLNPGEDIVLEVAVVVTDDDLNTLGQFTSLIVDEDPACFMPKRADSSARFSGSGKRFVYEPHFDNGLVTALCGALQDDPFLSLSHVEGQLVDFLNSMGVHKKLEMKDRPPLAGSTISFDRDFMKVHLPEALQLLHYRNVDVSTVRELAHRWWPELPDPEKKGAHRALEDILESIELLKYYREKEFICGS